MTSGETSYDLAALATSSYDVAERQSAERFRTVARVRSISQWAAIETSLPSSSTR